MIWNELANHSFRILANITKAVQKWKPIAAAEQQLPERAVLPAKIHLPCINDAYRDAHHMSCTGNRCCILRRF